MKLNLYVFIAHASQSQSTFQVIKGKFGVWTSFPVYPECLTCLETLFNLLNASLDVTIFKDITKIQDF